MGGAKNADHNDEQTTSERPWAKTQGHNSARNAQAKTEKHKVNEPAYEPDSVPAAPFGLGGR